MATIKQQRAVEKTLENLGSNTPKTQGQILSESGYAPAIVKNPHIITESKGFKELMEEHLPDNKLIKKHEQLLHDEESTIQIKALDMAYKLKGSYAPDKTQTLNLDLKAELSDPELNVLREKYEEELRAKLLQ